MSTVALKQKQVSLRFEGFTFFLCSSYILTLFIQFIGTIRPDIQSLNFIYIWMSYIFKSFIEQFYLSSSTWIYGIPMAITDGIIGLGISTIFPIQISNKKYRYLFYSIIVIMIRLIAINNPMMF